jgi:hypothetical protein
VIHFNYVVLMFPIVWFAACGLLLFYLFIVLLFVVLVFVVLMFVLVYCLQ